tara:strand:- start:54 stop:248 length:195 start_codon:yes stop_codon:yes gene_type:complete
MFKGTVVPGKIIKFDKGKTGILTGSLFNSNILIFINNKLYLLFLIKLAVVTLIMFLLAEKNGLT